VNILGINSSWHDSAACLVRDGVVVAAAEEERFTHVKHAKTTKPDSAYLLPFHAIDYCLGVAGMKLSDVDHVAYAMDPFILMNGSKPRFELPDSTPTLTTPPAYDPWKTIFMHGVLSAPRLLLQDVPFHLQPRFDVESSDHRWGFEYVEHHMAHAASAFYPSPFESAAVMILDGAGEKVTTLLGRAHGADISKLLEVELPHSLGKYYEMVTWYLGFLNTSDEYKVMAMASYGKPKYAAAFRSIVSWDDEGRYRIGGIYEMLVATCGPRRMPGEPFEDRHNDIASSMQVVLEECCVRLAQWVHEKTGEENLCMAGGVALNCVMNSKLAAQTPFKRIWVQPAAGDAGAALGAALWAHTKRNGQGKRWRMEDAYLGPEYTDAQIEKTLQHGKVNYRKCEDIADATARCLANGKIVGWFQGRMEFGPRALGARSVLATSTDPSMTAKLNELKDREDFRPVAPAVLEERAGDYFVGCEQSPYMLFVYQVRPEKADQVPAIRHVDGSARVQTVSASRSPLFHRTILRFSELSGVPVVVNTSFNTRGRPIVCNPQDAVECFFTSPLDVLSIGNFLVEK
jgi:carbamoyltransferase